MFGDKWLRQKTNGRADAGANAPLSNFAVNANPAREQGRTLLYLRHRLRFGLLLVYKT